MRLSILYGAMIWVLLVLFNTPNIAANQEFRYKYQPGTSYIIKSQVTQKVLDSSFPTEYSSDHENWITVHILQGNVGSGMIRATYQQITTHNVDSAISTITDESVVTMEQDSLGNVLSSNNQYLPMVRGVPRFPTQPITVGETWQFPATEIYNLESIFGISSTPFVVDTIPTYTYVGQQNTENNSNEYDVFEITYPIKNKKRVEVGGTALTISVDGSTKQTLLWDKENGYPHSYSEVFSYTWTMNGTTIKFSGTANAHVVPQYNTEQWQKIATDFSNQQNSNTLQDINIRVDDTGVILTLENIRFKPDSTEVAQGENQKLTELANILSSINDVQLVITGHTADTGFPDGEKKLSLQRANAVADFLLKHGINGVITRGVGATQPLGDNTTTDGKRLNRRVEVLLINK